MVNKWQQNNFIYQIVLYVKKYIFIIFWAYGMKKNFKNFKKPTHTDYWFYTICLCAVFFNIKV